MTVEQALKLKKWSIATLARTVQRDYGYVHRIVHRKRVPSPKIAEEISVALDRLVNPLEILYPNGLT